MMVFLSKEKYLNQAPGLIHIITREKCPPDTKSPGGKMGM